MWFILILGQSLPNFDLFGCSLEAINVIHIQDIYLNPTLIEKTKNMYYHVIL